jgi:hypothetical protein
MTKTAWLTDRLDYLGWRVFPLVRLKRATVQFFGEADQTRGKDMQE